MKEDSKMKKLLALALALVMMLSCANALATDLNAVLNKGATVKVEVSLDEDFVNMAMSMAGGSVPQQAAAMIPTLISIINKLAVQASVAGDKAEVDVFLGDVEVAGIGLISAADGGLELVSDLVPSSVVVVSPETLQQLMNMLQQYMSSLSSLNIDEEQLRSAIMPPLQQLIATISAKVGPTEQGLYTVDGYMFNAKTPVNITTKELFTAILTCARDIIGNSYVRKVIQQAASAMGKRINVSTADIDSALLSLQNTPDEEVPDLELALYANNDSYYLVMDMAMDGQSVNLHAGLIGNNSIVLNLSALDELQLSGYVKWDEAAMSFDARLDADVTQYGQTMYIGAALQGGMTSDGGKLYAALYFMNRDKAAVSTTITVTGDATFLLDYNTAGKDNRVDIQDLISGRGASVDTLMKELQTSLFTVIAKAQQAMPAEINALMQVIMSMQGSAY